MADIAARHTWAAILKTDSAIFPTRALPMLGGGTYVSSSCCFFDSAIGYGTNNPKGAISYISPSGQIRWSRSFNHAINLNSYAASGLFPISNGGVRVIYNQSGYVGQVLPMNRVMIIDLDSTGQLIRARQGPDLPSKLFASVHKGRAHYYFEGMENPGGGFPPVLVIYKTDTNFSQTQNLRLTLPTDHNLVGNEILTEADDGSLILGSTYSFGGARLGQYFALRIDSLNRLAYAKRLGYCNYGGDPPASLIPLPGSRVLFSLLSVGEYYSRQLCVDANATSCDPRLLYQDVPFQLDAKPVTFFFQDVPFQLTPKQIRAVPVTITQFEVFLGDPKRASFRDHCAPRFLPYRRDSIRSCRPPLVYPSRIGSDGLPHYWVDKQGRSVLTNDTLRTA